MLPFFPYTHSNLNKNVNVIQTYHFFNASLLTYKIAGKNTEEIEEVNLEKIQNGENDEEDLKTEVTVQTNERKFSKIFGTFKRKKISSSSATEVKTIESTNIERKYYYNIVNSLFYPRHYLQKKMETKSKRMKRHPAKQIKRKRVQFCKQNNKLDSKSNF